MSEKSEIVYRPIEKGDITSVTALFNSLFLVQKPDAYFTWQIFEYITPVVAMGAFYDGKLIGTFGIQKVTLENGLVCGRAHWPAISPDWQGKGVFYELTRMVVDQYHDLDFLFNFFPEKAKSAIEKSLDMKMHHIPIMVLTSSAKFDNPGVTISRTDEKTIFKRFSPAKAETCSFENTREYQLWRYVGNPVYSYDIVASDSGEYAVVKTFTDPATRDTYGDIVEVQCHPDDRRRINQLVLGACWYLKSRGMASITTWAMPGTVLQEVVEDIGFRQTPGSVPCYFGLKVLEPQYEYLYDFSRWRVQQCDHLKY